MRPEDTFDFRQPGYTAIIAARIARLERIRANPTLLPGLFAHYRDHPAEFITDWGMTYAPKATDGGPVVRPFILFPKQVEWIEWVVRLWKNHERGLTEKSRESGVTWLAVALGATLCLFHKDMTIGYGANLVDLVDTIGDIDSILEKARFFVDNLPVEFTGGWDSTVHSKHKLLRFPQTGSIMKGQGGDNIGRGGRAHIYFVDEFAHIARAEAVDAALSQTVNTQIDISTVRGSGNAFAVKRHSGRVDVFTFRWQSDPRKDDAWYAKMVAQFDPVIVAQEIDINYNASVEGIVIPSEWVSAAVDAHVKLGIKPTGRRRGALDVADEGKDKNAFAVARGALLESVVEWSGKGSDLLYTAQRAFAICDDAGVEEFRFDADGMGASMRGDARVLNESRKDRKIRVSPWRGSGAVVHPDKAIPSAIRLDRKDRTNKDYFANAKAQGWWDLRVRFQRTYRAVMAKQNGEPDPGYSPDDMIFLDSKMPELPKLISELSRPTRIETTTGKIQVDKGEPSPNLADAVMILMAPGQRAGYDLAAAL